MPVHDDFDILIISDLHMSAGYNARIGTFNRNEDFFYDDALGRFIEHYIRSGQDENRRYRLVILGDFFDFLQVDVKRQPGVALTSSGQTVKKLDRINRGHPGVVQALARWIDHGHRLDVVVGNHDIELSWPEVQDRFKQLVAAHVNDANTDERIQFHPWFLYIPGVMYAEHGHQYDRDNSFLTEMQPFLPFDPTAIELPLGSFFVLYLFNHIERLDPFADNVRPATRYLAWALRTHPLVVFRTFFQHLFFFNDVLRKTGNPGSQPPQERQAQYRRAMLPEFAARVGLPLETVQKIDELAAFPSIYSKRQVLQRLVIEPLFPSFPLLVGGVIALYQASKRLSRGARAFSTLGAGIVALLWRARAVRTAAKSGHYLDINNYLYEAAQDVHDILQQSNAAVPVYIFGHTHTAEQYPLSKDAASPRYINTGTWTPLVPQSFDLLARREQFTYVRINRDQTGVDQRPVAELLRWNDDAGRSELFPSLSLPALDVEVEDTQTQQQPATEARVAELAAKLGKPLK